MTQGVRIIDERQSLSLAGMPPDLIGEYFIREWNGADQDKTRPLEDHPYWMRQISTNNPICHIQVRDRAPSPSYSLKDHIGGVFFNEVPLWDNNDELKLLNKLAERIRGSDFNAGNLIVESNQTMVLVATTATRIAKSIDLMKEGKFSTALKTLKTTSKNSRARISSASVHRGISRSVSKMTPGDVSDLALEWQYGVRPLVSDVYSSAKSLSQMYELPYKQSYSAQRTVRMKLVDQPGYAKLLHTGKRYVRLKVTLLAPPDTLTQLHLNDPLSAIWEKTPWSFVADWFLPIGDYLGALNFVREFNIGHVVRSDLTVHNHRFLSFDPVADIIASSGFDEGKYEFVYFERSLPSLTAGSIPMPNLKNVEKALSPEHVFNALALLTSSADGFSKQLKF